MKKFVFFLLVAAISLGMVNAQEIAVSIEELPTTGLNPGDPIKVNVSLDAITYTGTNYVKSAQLFITYDPAVLTPTLGPFGGYFDDLNFYFLGAGSIPSTAVPTPGDWRMVFFTTAGTGINMIPGTVMFSIPFIYNGGDTPLEWGLTAKLSPVEGEANGGKMSKGETKFTDWTDAVFPWAAGNPVNGCVGTCGAVLATNWTGAVDMDWFNAGNWDNGVPDATTDAVVPVTLNDPMISGGVAETQMLDVDAGVFLTVWNDGALTTNGLFTNDGLLYVDGTVSGGVSGSFIDNGGMAGTGQFEFFQDVAGLTAPAADPTGWHYLSSPVAGFDSDQMWDYYVNFWDEPNDTWVNHTGNPNVPCDPAPNVTMGAMEAWSTKFDVVWPGVNNCPGGTGLVVEFFGNTMADVHTGPYSAPATVGGTFEGGGWNFFGNPYPSSVDPALITWDAGMNQSVYYWDGFADTYVSWAGGVGSVIPPTQGFFTQSTAPGTMAFAGTERIHGSDWFWKSEISNLLKLEATNVNVEGTRDNVYVRFLEDATVSFDKVWDAKKLMSYVPGVPQIYTTNGTDKLSIDAQPQANEVPMSFESVETGTFNIAAIEAADFSTVILEDKFTATFTDLLTSSYTFEHTAGATADRFVIHFAPLGVEDMNAANISIWSNENNIMVQAPSVNGDIVVFNMMGQEVIRTDIAPGINVIPMDDVNTYYVVKVLTSDNAVTGKVFIK